LIYALRLPEEKSSAEKAERRRVGPPVTGNPSSTGGKMSD